MASHRCDGFGQNFRDIGFYAVWLSQFYSIFSTLRIALRERAFCYLLLLRRFYSSLCLTVSRRANMENSSQFVLKVTLGIFQRNEK